MPATLQERWFARAYPLMPLIIAVLAVFWIISGMIGVLQFQEAASVLTDRGFSNGVAGSFVGLGALADIAVGACILYRPWARHACVGMMALASGYVVGASLFAPDLWADPLGPMVKVVPSIALALVAYALLDER